MGHMLNLHRRHPVPVVIPCVYFDILKLHRAPGGAVTGTGLGGKSVDFAGPQTAPRRQHRHIFLEAT